MAISLLRSITAAVFAGLLMAGCAKGVSSQGDTVDPPASSGNKWDEMKWDQGKWE